MAPPRSVEWLRRLKEALASEVDDSESEDDLMPPAAAPRHRLSWREQLDAALGEDDDSSSIVEVPRDPGRSAGVETASSGVHRSKETAEGGEEPASRAREQRRRRMTKLRARRAASGETTRMTAWKRKRLALAKTLGDRRRQKLQEKRRQGGNATLHDDVQAGAVVGDARTAHSSARDAQTTRADAESRLGGALETVRGDAKDISTAAAAAAPAERGFGRGRHGWPIWLLRGQDSSSDRQLERHESQDRAQDHSFSSPSVRTSLARGLERHTEGEVATDGIPEADSLHENPAMKPELIPTTPCESILHLSGDDVANSAATLELCANSDTNSEGSGLQNPLQRGQDEHTVSPSLSQPTQSLPATQSSDVDSQVLELRESNEKLSQRLDEMQQRLPALESENAALRRQVERLQEDNNSSSESSDARLVLLLEEQVRGLQRRESELMRALARS